MKTDFLLVDIGNTRIKWATARANGPVRLKGQRPTAKLSAGWIRALAAQHSGRQLVLASVVPKWNAVFVRAFRGRAAVVSGSLAALRNRFAYPEPAKLGADRIAAAIAAHAGGLFPAIIVACGTATAFTVLDAKGRICGGAIAPGLQAQLDALIGSTAQLPAPTLRMPRSALAKSTRDAIRVGVLLSFQGGVKEIIRHLSASLPGDGKSHILVTGGHARHLVRALGLPHQPRPLLVFEGLRIMGKRLTEAAK